MNQLLLGDCLVLMKSLADESVDLILTDLPYGTTSCKWDATIPLNLMWAEYLRLLRPRGTIALTASQPFTSQLVMSNLKMFRVEWIWEKNRGSNFATTKYFPMKEHESILIFGRAPGVFNPIMEERAETGKSRVKTPIKASNTGKREVMSGFIDKYEPQLRGEMRVPRSIQKFNTEVGLHPTQKPVSLFEYLIKTYTNPGMQVLDSCMGSGTTGVACRRLGRDFIGMELDPAYFELAQRRIMATIPAHELADAAGVPGHDAAAHNADHGIPERKQPAADLPAQRAEGEPAAAGAGGAVDAGEQHLAGREAPGSDN